MKRFIAGLIIAASVLSVASCGGNTAAETKKQETEATEAAVKKEFKASEVTAAILDEIAIASAFEKSVDSFNDFFTDLDTESLTDSSYYICASGAFPDEIAVFKFKDAEAAKAAEPTVKERLESQKATYETYTPDEFYKLEGAVLEVKDEYLYYLVTSDNDRAKEIVKSFIG
ncbi:MAG: DUF4358 domain-containing protein [Ruminiclostridium sp.]